MLPCVCVQCVQGLDTIVIDMAEYFNNSKVQKAACKAIHMIAQKDEYAGDYLGREGACEAIIAAILKHCMDSEVVYWGLLAVSALALCDFLGAIGAHKNVIMLSDAGACGMIATVMQRHSGDTAVLTSACTAVSKCTSHSAQAVKLVEASVHISVINAITQHMDNAELVKYGCAALADMTRCNTEMRIALGNGGICEVLPKVLIQHIDNSEIVHFACNAVQDLAACHDTNIKLGNCNACKAVVDALKANNSNEDMSILVCNAIYNLTLNGDTTAKLVKACVCAVLATTMQKHSDKTLVLRPACKAMYRLTQDNAIDVAKLVQAGVHITVINAMKHHMPVGNVDLINHGCAVLARLSYHSTTDMKATMGNDGLCEVMFQVLWTHFCNPDIVLNACMTIRCLAVCDFNSVKLGDCGACKAVVDALAVHIGDVDVVGAGCGAVEMLAAHNKANRNKLKAAGVRTELYSVLKLHSGHPELVSMAQRALRAVAYFSLSGFLKQRLDNEQ
jgi:hypothetical protein